MTKGITCLVHNSPIMKKANTVISELLGSDSLLSRESILTLVKAFNVDKNRGRETPLKESDIDEFTSFTKKYLYIDHSVLVDDENYENALKACLENDAILNYCNTIQPGTTNYVHKYKTLKSILNDTVSLLTFENEDIYLAMPTSYEYPELDSSSEDNKKDLLSEIQKLKKLNRSLGNAGSAKKQNELLKKAGIDPIIRKAITTAVEEDSKLGNLTPYQIFHHLASLRYKDLESEYHKAIEQPIIEKLESHLIGFLKKYNIDIIDGSELCKQHGVLGAYDILRKTIHLAKDRNALTMPEEAAHAIIELLGSIPHKNLEKFPETRDYTFLYDTVESTEIYKRVFEEYKDVYTKKENGETVPDINKIKKEAIGQALAVAIKENWENTNLEKEQSFWEKLKELFNFIISQFKNAEYISFESLIDSIAKDVINNNYKRFNKIDSKGFELLDYSKTLAEQNKKDGGKSLEFLKYFSSIGNLITGSLAYRRQGSVYRGKLDAIHDIDMTVPSTAHKIEIPTIVKSASHPNTNLFNIVTEKPYFEQISKKYPKIKYLAAYLDNNKDTITVNAVYSEDEELSRRFSIYSGSYASRLNNFTEEERSKIYLFDFFLESENNNIPTTNKDFENDITFADWPRIFKAKILEMGRAKDIFDYQSWKLFDEFKSNIPSEKEFLMFQKPKSDTSLKSTESNQTEQNTGLQEAIKEYNKIKDYFNKNYRFIAENHTYLKINKDGTPKSVQVSVTEFIKASEDGTLSDILKIPPAKRKREGASIYTAIGNSFDRLVRDYFNGIDVSKTNYPNLNRTLKQNLISSLKAFEDFLNTKFGEGKYKVFTEEFPIGGEVDVNINGKIKKISIAGTMDMVIVTESKDYYFYDMKTTSKSIENWENDSVDTYRKQLSMYKQIVQANFKDVGIKGLGLLLSEINWPNVNREDLMVLKDGSIYLPSEDLNKFPTSLDSFPDFNIQIKVWDGGNYIYPLTPSTEINGLKFHKADKTFSVEESREAIQENLPYKDISTSAPEIKVIKKDDIENLPTGQDKIKEYLNSPEATKIVTPTEISTLASDIFKMASYFITNLVGENSEVYKDFLFGNLEDNKYKDIDFKGREVSELLRDETLKILDTVLDTVIETSLYSVLDTENPKIDWVLKHMKVIKEEGYATLLDLEDVSIDLVFTKESSKHTEENDNDSQFIDNAEESVRETYDISANEKPFIANIATRFKRRLSLIPKYVYDDNGNKVKDEEFGEYIIETDPTFGTYKFIDARELINTIAHYTHNLKSKTAMMQKLKKLSQKKAFYYLKDVLEYLEANPEAQTHLFTVFRTNESSYYKWYYTTKPVRNGDSISWVKVLNYGKVENTNAADRWRNNLFEKFREGNIPKFLNSEKNNLYTINIDIREKITKAKNIQDFSKMAGAYVDILTDLGFEPEYLDPLYDYANVEILKSIKNYLNRHLAKNGIIGELLNNKTDSKNGDLSTVSYTPFNINALSKFYKGLTNRLSAFYPSNIDRMAYDSGRSYAVFTSPSFLKSLIETLSDKNGETSLKELFTNPNSIYNKSGQFYVTKPELDNSGRVEKVEYVNSWLNALKNDTELGKLIKYSTMTSFDGNEYSKQSDLEYAKAILANYTIGYNDSFYYDYNIASVEKEDIANFTVPIMSDKSEYGTITFIKEAYIGQDNIEHGYIESIEQVKEAITDKAFNYFTMELNRMYDVLHQINNDSSTDVDMYNLDRKKASNIVTKIQNKEGIVLSDLVDTKNKTLHKYIEESGLSFKFVYTINNSLINNTELGKAIIAFLNTGSIDSNMDIKNLFTKEFIEYTDARFETFKYYITDLFTSTKGKEPKPLNLLPFQFVTSGIKEYYGKDKSGVRPKEILLEEFFWNNMLAVMNIINLTNVDAAFNKNAVDQQKRYSQVHSSTQKADVEATFTYTDSSGNTQNKRFSEDGKFRFAVIEDEFAKSGFLVDALKILDNAKEGATPQEINELEISKGILESAFKKVNVTDGQAFSSPTGFWKKYGMLGEITPEWTEAIREIAKGNMTLSNFSIVMQPFKPFVYGWVEKESSEDSKLTGSKYIPTQIKDSEAVLLVVAAMQKANKEETILTKLYDLMEDSHYDGEKHTLENYNGKGIDTIAFKSAVKMGSTGVINTKNISVEDLKNLIYTKEGSYNPVYTHELPYDSWGKQQAVPYHLYDHEQAMGSQPRIIIPSDIPETVTSDNPILVRDEEAENGYKKYGKEDYEKAYFGALQEDYNLGKLQLYKTLDIEETEEGKLVFGPKFKEKLSRILQRDIINDARFTSEFKKAFTLLNGDFYIALKDPTISEKVLSVIFSLIKKNINNQKFPGGPVVQRSPFGIIQSSALQMKTDAFGGLYYEAYITFPTSELEKKFKKKDGTYYTIEEALKRKKISSEDLEMIAYRIPTEEKYSTFRCKIKGFLPRIGGEVIILPQEIPAISGADFDIDKLYIMLKYSKEDLKKGDKDTKDRKRLKNKIFDLMYGVMGHPSYAVDSLKVQTTKNISDIAATLPEDSKIDSMVYADVQLEMHKRNLAGKEFVGIAALNNIAHKSSKFCNLELTVPQELAQWSIIYGGSEINLADNVLKLYSEDNIATYKIPIDKTYSPINGENASKNISTLVGVSADNAKEALLGKTNITPNTATVALGLLRMGIPQETIIYMLNLPTVKRLSRSKGFERDIMTYYEAEIKDLILDNDMLKKAVITPEKVENIEEIEKTALKFMAQSLNVCRKISDLNTIFGLNSSKNAVGPDAYKTIAKEYKLYSLYQDPEMSSIVEKVFQKIPHLKTLSDVFTDIMPQLGKEFSALYSESFRNVLDQLNEDYSYPITEKSIKDVFNDYLVYLATVNEYLPSNISELFENTPKIINELKTSAHYNNELIKALDVEILTQRYQLDAVTLENSVYDREGKQFITNDWENLYNNENTREKAIQLAKYMLIRFGFNWAPKSAFHLVPNVMKNKNSDFYNIFKEDSLVPIKDFIILFLRNNTENKNLFHKISTLEEGQHLEDLSYKAINYNGIYYIKTSDGVTSIERLGIPNQLLEYPADPKINVFKVPSIIKREQNGIKEGKSNSSNKEKSIFSSKIKSLKSENLVEELTEFVEGTLSEIKGIMEDDLAIEFESARNSDMDIIDFIESGNFKKHRYEDIQKSLSAILDTDYNNVNKIKEKLEAIFSSTNLGEDGTFMNFKKDFNDLLKKLNICKKS